MIAFSDLSLKIATRGVHLVNRLYKFSTLSFYHLFELVAEMCRERHWPQKLEAVTQLSVRRECKRFEVSGVFLMSGKRPN